MISLYGIAFTIKLLTDNRYKQGAKHLKLIKYSEINESEYISYIEEWEATGVRINPYATTRDGRPFDEMMGKWQWDESEVVREKDLVPATLYFLSDDSGRLYGAIHLRHELNENLRQYGGHIGYGIRPSERRKGYATLQLKLMIDKMREMGYKKAMITCDLDNIGSSKTIENNGGLLEAIVEHDHGKGKIYWINI